MGCFGTKVTNEFILSLQSTFKIFIRLIGFQFRLSGKYQISLLALWNTIICFYLFVLKLIKMFDSYSAYPIQHRPYSSWSKSFIHIK